MVDLRKLFKRITGEEERIPSNFLCVEAITTDSPHGSGEASDVIYDDNPLVCFTLYHFRHILSSFNVSIIVLKLFFRSKN